MSDPLQVDHPGAFGSFLRWLGRPKNAVVDALSGNLEGAARQLGDFVGDAVDAPLPGDWIPEFSRSTDYGEASDLAGGMEPGIAKTAVDVLGGIALDPISYIPGGLVLKGAAKGAEIAGKGAKLLPESAQQGLQSAKLTAKSALGYLKTTPERQAILDKANNVKANVGRAGLTKVEDLFKGVPESQRKDLFDVIQNIKETEPGKFAQLNPEAVTPNPIYGAAKTAEENTRAAGSAERIVPEDDYLQVAEAKQVRPKSDAISKRVGIEGVAPQLDLPFRNSRLGRQGKAMLDSVDPGVLMSGIAGKVRDQAFPMQDVLAKYSSGIEHWDRSFVKGAGPAKSKTYGPELPPVKDVPVTGGDEALRVKQAAERTPRGATELSDRIDPLTGQPITKAKYLGRGELPNMLERVNEKLGGVPAETTAMGAKQLPRSTDTFDSVEGQLANWGKRIDAMDRTPEEKAALKGLAAKYLPYSADQFREGAQELGAFSKPIGRDLEREVPVDYAQRQFSGLTPEENIGIRGEPAATKERVLKTGESLVSYLNSEAGAGVSLERDLGKIATGRASQQADLARRATIGKGLIGDKFVSLADEGTKGAVSEAIAAMKEADPEGHALFQSAWGGLGKRHPAMEMLARTNKIFKPAAVYGLLFPRVGGIMKNILAFPAQIGMTPAAGGLKGAGQQILKTPATVYSAMRAGVGKAFGLNLPAGKLDEASDLIDAAFQQSGGRASRVAPMLRAQGREDLASAVENGVTDGFVSREAIEDSIKNSSWGRRIMSAIGMGQKAQDRTFNMIDAPGAAFQGAEHNARLGNYLQLLKDGKSPADAANAVREALYDYTVKTKAERNLRTLIPFAAWQANSGRASAKFLAKNPAAAVGIGALFSEKKDEPIYPYMEGKTNFPLGADAKGNQEYVTNFGLPFETLSQVPNPSDDIASFARDIKRNVVGSAHPLLKAGSAAVFGEDPYFETPYGSYDKLPVYGSAGAVGRAYNKLAGTGLIQPLVTPLQTLNSLTDDRKSLPVRALDTLTGASVVNVDPDLALQQRLTSFLKSNPGVSQYTSFYQHDQDSETKQLLEALRQAKARIKEKRKADPGPSR